MSETLKRNDPCHCGSGKKYKNCCLEKDQAGTKSKLGLVVLGAAILLGLLLAGIAIFGDGGSQNCPSGTTWSSTHQHCH